MDPTRTAENAQRSPGRPRATLAGALALLLGGIALIFASIEALASFTVPVSIAGLVAGAFGVLFALAQPQRPLARALPIMGTVLCLIICATAHFMPWLLGPVYSTWRNDNHPGGSDAMELIPLNFGKADKSPLEREGWADASLAAIQQGQIRVRIIDAKVGAIELRPDKEDWAGKKFLVIRLQIQQVGGRHNQEFYHWGGPGPRTTSARPKLSDDSGKEYKLIEFDDDTLIRGQTLHFELHAGAIVPDLLVFETPPPSTGVLRLVLPAHAWEGRGNFKFFMAESFVKR